MDELKSCPKCGSAHGLIYCANCHGERELSVNANQLRFTPLIEQYRESPDRRES